jgi:hypothetical protein
VASPIDGLDYAWIAPWFILGCTKAIRVRGGRDAGASSQLHPRFWLGDRSHRSPRSAGSPRCGRGRFGNDEGETGRWSTTWFEADQVLLLERRRLPTEAEWEYAARRSQVYAREPHELVRRLGDGR